MDEQNIHDEKVLPEEQREVYVPRPMWQIVCAWIGVSIVAIGFVLYCWQIATAGGT